MAQCIPWAEPPSRVVYGVKGEREPEWIQVADAFGRGITLHIGPHDQPEAGASVTLSRSKAARLASELVRMLG